LASRQANSGVETDTLKRGGIACTVPKFINHGRWMKAQRVAGGDVAKAQVAFVCETVLFAGEKLTITDLSELVPSANTLQSDWRHLQRGRGRDRRGGKVRPPGGQLKLSAPVQHLFMIERGWKHEVLNAMNEDEFAFWYDKAVAHEDAKCEAKGKLQMLLDTVNRMAGDGTLQAWATRVTVQAGDIDLSLFFGSEFAQLGAAALGKAPILGANSRAVAGGRKFCFCPGLPPARAGQVRPRWLYAPPLPRWRPMGA
jgi:hypothetical protein